MILNRSLRYKQDVKHITLFYFSLKRLGIVPDVADARWMNDLNMVLGGTIHIRAEMRSRKRDTEIINKLVDALEKLRLWKYSDQWMIYLWENWRVK